MRRRLSTLILLLAVATMVTAAVRWRGASGEIAARSAERAALQSEMDTTRTSLRKMSLRYQGFLKGASAVPDSIRLSTAGASMQQSNIYRKNITRLEGEERRLKTMMETIDVRVAEAVAARRRSVLPLAGLAALFLAAGAVLFATERARRVAS